MKHHEGEGQPPLAPHTPDTPPQPPLKPRRAGQPPRGQPAWPFPAAVPARPAQPPSAELPATPPGPEQGPHPRERTSGKAARAFFAMAALFCAGAVAQPAPATIGEALDQGGAQLSAAEVKALLTGARIAGLGGARQAPFELNLSGDGRLSGVVGRARLNATGTWTVNDQGQLCTVVSWSSGESASACAHWFKLGGSYFTSVMTTRDAVAMARTVTK
ncbi:MAG: hypothetical protein JNJ89_01100 [Rubrivivax sp.]|nr:hypothetical protein [Rubrivivax sp.]